MFCLAAMTSPAASSLGVKSSSMTDKPVGVAAPTKPNSPAPDPATASADTNPVVSGPLRSAEANSTPLSDPKLRSVPASCSVKTEPEIAPAVIPTTTVIDVDSDWASRSPMDYSASMKLALPEIESPPNELATDCNVASESTKVAACAIIRRSTSRELPIGSLRSDWITSSKPLTKITKPYLMLDQVANRVDVVVYRATEARGDRGQDDSQWCAGAHSRLVEVCKGHYCVPISIKCDRTLFSNPNDSIYIERMWLYLFNESSDQPPVCVDERLYEVVVAEDKATVQKQRLMWALLIMRKRVVTFEDFFVSRRSTTDLSKTVVAAVEDTPLLSVPWELFPSVPKWLSEVVDLRSAHVSPVRALTFFTDTARRAGSKVYQRWNKALQIELAMHIAVAHFTAWARPVIDQPRIWFPSEEHVSWLKRFEHLPPIPVYYEALGKHLTVSIADVVRVLEDTRARATPTSRKDYCTKTMVEFVATPNSQVFTTDPLREALLKPIANIPSTSGAAATSAQPRLITKANSGSSLTPKGVIFGRVIKRDSLRKHTKIPAEIIASLKGNGPWTVVEIIDHVVVDRGSVLAKNESLTGEVNGLREELQRLRDDMSRYRDDASRLSGELRQLRESTTAAAYGDGSRGYGSRSCYDPYERRY